MQNTHTNTTSPIPSFSKFKKMILNAQKLIDAPKPAVAIGQIWGKPGDVCLLIIDINESDNVVNALVVDNGKWWNPMAINYEFTLYDRTVERQINLFNNMFIPIPELQADYHFHGNMKQSVTRFFKRWHNRGEFPTKLLKNMWIADTDINDPIIEAYNEKIEKMCFDQNCKTLNALNY